jgi:hypothetical protein
MNTETPAKSSGPVPFICAFMVVMVAFILFMCSGCASITGYEADEVHHKMSVPLLFNDSIKAIGIKKTTNADGSVTRKAETLTHETDIVGVFNRNVTYKGAKIKEAKE